MKTWAAKIGFVIVLLLSSAAAADQSGLLRIDGRTVTVTNKTPVEVTGPAEFQVVGPLQFEKDEENGWVFDVSVVSFAASDAVLSVTAERLRSPADARLDYSDLPASDWPAGGFHELSHTCMGMTRKKAEALPENSGIHEILAAGFVPEGDFAVASAITSSKDGRDEVSIETISRVESCEDKAAVDRAIETMRGLLRVATPE